MIDLMFIEIDVLHQPFGTTRKIKRKGVPYELVKQYSEKVRFLEDSATILVTSMERGAKIRIRGCPLKVLQGHNAFGTNNVVGLGFALIRNVLDVLDIDVPASQLDEWKEGDFKVLEIHITERLKLPRHRLLKPLLLHMFRALSERFCPAWLETGVGFTLIAPHRHATWMFYDKLEWFEDKRHGAEKHLAAFLPESIREECFQLVKAEAASNIRAELRLFHSCLEENGLDTGRAWTRGKPREVFLKEEELLRFGRLPTVKAASGLADKLECNLLKQTYMLWLHGEDVRALHSPALYRSRRDAIEAKIGVNIELDTVTRKLRDIELQDVFCEENVMPARPGWLDDFPNLYYRGGDLGKGRKQR